MQTRSLRTLVRIMQVQSFSVAAELQNMTLSAVSMQMKALENELGAELFDRSFRPPKLTPLGRLVAEQAQSVIDKTKSITEICGLNEPLTGSYQLGFIQSANVRILPDFLRLAQKKAPLAHFHCSSGLSENLIQNVELGKIDAAIVTRVGALSPQLHCELIASEEMCIAAPKTHSKLTANQLAESIPFIHFMPSTGIGKLIASSLMSAGISHQHTLVLDSIEVCMECVKSGLGYTILPKPDIERYADRNIVIMETAFPPIARDLVLVSHQQAGNKHWSSELHSLLMLASQ